MAAPEKSDGPELSPGLWGGVTVLAILSIVAYAYSFGYLFRIEPQFISAFSPVDLILWAASSLYIILAIGFTMLTTVGATVFARTTVNFLKPRAKDEGETAAEDETATEPVPLLKIVVWGAIVLIIGAFVFGDIEGRAARRPTGQSRARVCGDQGERGPCYPLIFLGSEKLVFAVNGKFVLRKIEDRHIITSAGTPPYVPKPVSTTPS